MVYNKIKISKLEGAWTESGFIEYKELPPAVRYTLLDNVKMSEMYYDGVLYKPQWSHRTDTTSGKAYDDSPWIHGDGIPVAINKVKGCL